MEEWRDIIGYEGKYQVSNLGRIKSLSRIDSRGHKRKEKILIGNPNTDKYLEVYLYKNGEREPFLVHRLVAQAFIPNHKNLPDVNHKDENPTNNHVDNLEWCTKEYNNNYGNRTKKASQSRIKKIKCINTGETFNGLIEASKKYNTSTSSISKCCLGQIKSAGKHPITGEKLVWKYV